VLAGPDAGVEVGARILGAVSGSPETEEGVLDDVLGVGGGVRPLAGEEEHRRPVLPEPG